MIVVDTHAWLWLTSDPARLSAPALAAVQAAGSIGVSTISCWEVGMLVVAGRITIDRDPRRWIRLALAASGTATLPVTAEIAVSAALLPSAFPGDPADRLIYATSVAHGVPLITRDDRISAFDARRTIW